MSNFDSNFSYTPLDDSRLAIHRLNGKDSEMSPNMTVVNEAISIGINRPSRFTAGIAILTLMIIALNRAASRKQFPISHSPRTGRRNGSPTT